MKDSIDSLLFVTLDSLLFDPENPRLPSSLRGSQDEHVIIDHLLRDEGLTDLMASIAQTGYAKAEPLLVIPQGQESFIVVEGNRRLAALKLLNDPSLATVRKLIVKEIAGNASHRPTKDIPVIKYEARDEIIDYLGYRHITGIKEWDSMAKARYLKQLYERHIGEAGSSIFSVLAKMIGSKPNYVARLLTALKVCDYANDRAYFSLPGITEDKIEFSLVTTALSYTKIVKFLGLESADDPSIPNIKEDACKDLFEWMFVKNDQNVTRLGESRALKELSKVVDFPEALEKFRLGISLAEAVLYTDEPNETFLNFIIKAKDDLKNAKNCLEQISTPPDGVHDILKEISNLSKTIIGALEGRFTKADPTNFENLSKSDIEKLKILLNSLDKGNDNL